MLFESARQAPLFAVFICCGIILGAVYDLFYVFRQKRKGVFVHISDFIFALIFFVTVSVFLMLFNSGKPEFYFFFGIFLGFFAERVTLGYFIKIFIDICAKILYNLNISLGLKEKLKRLLK